MILHTTCIENKEIIVEKLEKRHISYLIDHVTERKINVFFGASYCLDVLKTFPHLKLNSIPPEYDFILGAMLGYDMEEHCQRHLRIRERSILKKEQGELKVI